MGILENRKENRDMGAVDTHCDIIAGIYKDHERRGRQPILENRLMLDLRKIQAGDYGLQNLALYVNLEQAEGSPFESRMELLDTFCREMGVHEDIIGIVRTYDDVRRSWEQGRISALLTMEGGGARQGRTVLLRDLYQLGIRMMTLTWNFPNKLAFPNVRIKDVGGTFRMAPDTEYGPTDTGVALAEGMERLGVITDISHLDDVGIWDIFRCTDKPLVTNHSSARIMTPHPGNLIDDVIRALAERDDVMGINYRAAFPRDFEPGEKQLSRIPGMVERVKRIRKIGDIGCIGLGSNFDGISGNLEMRDVGELPMLTDAMEREGFTASEIEAVFYKNVLRVYKDIL